jgi:hypothetical protein
VSERAGDVASDYDGPCSCGWEIARPNVTVQFDGMNRQWRKGRWVLHTEGGITCVTE